MRNALLFVLCTCFASPAAAQLTADQIIKKVVALDPWGLAGSELSARLTVKNDAGGATREIVVTGRSRTYAPGLTKSLLRLQAPADVKGVGFLQIQKNDADDERHLFLPELKKSKRIAGDLRGTAFMGTDFFYSDLDRRDLRQSASKLLGEEKLAGHACWKIEATPQVKGAPYAKMVLWIRKDTMVPLKIMFYAPSGGHVKTFLTNEAKKIKGQWYIVKATMVNHKEKRRTELVMDKLDPRTDILDSEFTVRNVEKL